MKNRECIDKIITELYQQSGRIKHLEYQLINIKLQEYKPPVYGPIPVTCEYDISINKEDVK